MLGLLIFSLLLFSGVLLTANICLHNRKDVLFISFMVSTIHALVVGIYGLVALNYETSCLAMESLSKPYYLLDFTISYLFCDLVFVAFWDSPRSIVYHHILSILGLVLGRITGLGYGVALSFLRTELSTIPLNICWYLKQTKRDRGMTLWVAGVSLLLSYFFFRILASKWLILSCIPEIYDSAPLPLAIPGSIIVLFNCVMNFVWYIQIINKFLFTVNTKNINSKEPTRNRNGV